MKVNIVTPEKIPDITQALHAAHKKIVVAGGCFDIIHSGHILFLDKAKQQGDVLFVMLENDNRIQELKGKNRPINTQYDRAVTLSAIEFVDYVILLPDMKTNGDYDNIISMLKPSLIATTAGDPNRHHKERQAKLYGAELVDVIENIGNKSTTQIAKLLQKES